MISILIGKETIAVSNISEQGLTEFQASLFFNTLETELVNMGGYDVTSRQEVDKILKEQQFQKSGCTDQQCAAEIGRMLNADKMLLSEVLYERSSKSISINLKLVDVETAQITTAISKFSKVTDPTVILDNISDYLTELYRKDNADKTVNNNLQQGYQQKINKRKGALLIKSNPVGAKISVDNTNRGLTPKELKDIDEGEHKLILTFEGYERFTQKVTVIADSLLEVNGNLVPQSGNLYINSNPTGSNLYIDEEFKGITPVTLEYLDVGSYFIRIENETYEDYQAKVTVDYNQTTSKTINLKPKPGSISVFSIPGKSKVYINNEFINTTASDGGFTKDGLDPNDYTIEVRKKQYFSETKKITLKPAENIDLEFSLQRRPQGVSEDPNVGWLSIDGPPNDAIIHIYRQSPSLYESQKEHLVEDKYIELYKGIYNYQISKSGYRSIEGTVHIQPREHQKMNLMIKPYDKGKARLYSWLFPGLGHRYIEKPLKSIAFSSLATLLIAKSTLQYIEYSDRTLICDTAYQDYIAATHDISDKRDVYVEAFNDKQNSLYLLIGYSGLTAGAWIWNISDLNNSIPRILSDNISNISIDINSKGELQASVKF